MAKAMQMPLRSYQNLEAGKVRPHIETIFAIASALKADPIAMLAAILLETPEIAVRCADNKLVSAMLMNLSAFNDRLGDEIKQLRTSSIEMAFTHAFDELTVEAQRPERTAAWIAEHLLPFDPPEPEGSG